MGRTIQRNPFTKFTFLKNSNLLMIVAPTDEELIFEKH